MYRYGLLGVMWLITGTVVVQATVADIARDRGLRVTGSVERLVDTTGTREETALVTFVAADGQRVQTSVYTGFFADAPDPGQRVGVAYDPRDPRHARLLGADDLSVPVILFGTVSIVLVMTYALSGGRPRWRSSGPG